MEIIKVILTSLLSAAVLFLLAKIMGHKQISQLDFFDYITGITIGSIAAELATELEDPLKPLIAMVVYLLKSYGFIQNRHVIIESKATKKVQYSPSLRNNQFSPSRCVYFSPKIKHLKKVRKIRFFKIPIFQKFESFKKITPN